MSNLKGENNALFRSPIGTAFYTRRKEPYFEFNFKLHGYIKKYKFTNYSQNYSYFNCFILIYIYFFCSRFSDKNVHSRFVRFGFPVVSPTVLVLDFSSKTGFFQEKRCPICLKLYGTSVVIEHKI